MAPRTTGRIPALGLLYAGAFINGMGVVLLGPLLPRLVDAFSLSDASTGALLAAQFLGSSLGTIFVLRRSRLAVLGGSLLSWVGISLLALLLKTSPGSSTLALGCLSLFVYGFGLGQAMTAINLGVGEKTEGRAARLSLGNALWSVGAILSPALLAVALVRVSPTIFLSLFGAGFALMALALHACGFSAGNYERGAEATNSPADQASKRPGIKLQLLFRFAALLFFYAGAETCFSGWLTTFAHRAAGSPEAVSPLSTSAFWCGVAGGRLLGSGLLRRFPERRAMTFLLSGAALVSLGLVLSQSILPLIASAVCCGGLLGPVFPAALSSLFNLRPTPRQCGMALACAGFGAAVLPFVLGLIAQRLSSLRVALSLPVACVLLMLALVLRLRSARRPPQANPQERLCT